MPSFAYHAQSQNGQTEKGTIEAATKTDALLKLASQRKQVFKLEESQSAKSKFTFDLSAKPDLQKFFEDLAELVGSGMKVDVALKVMSENRNSKANQKLYDEVLAEIATGSSIAKSLSRQTSISPDVAALVAVGEESGQLVEVLPVLSETMKQARERSRDLFEALSYPCFLILVMIMAVFAIANFLIPSIEPLFDGSAEEIPFILSFFIGLREIADNLIFGILLISSSTALGMILPSSRAYLSNLFSWIMLRIPVLGQAVKLSNTSRYLRSLSIMLSNGVHLHEATRLAAESVSNTHIKFYLLLIPNSVTEGVDFPSALKQSGVFEPEVISIVSIGDQINKLDVMTKRAANLLDSRSDRTIKKLTAMVSPFVTILMGLVIGTLAYSVMTAMLSINDLAV